MMVLWFYLEAVTGNRFICTFIKIFHVFYLISWMERHPPLHHLLLPLPSLEKLYCVGPTGSNPLNVTWLLLDYCEPWALNGKAALIQCLRMIGQHVYQTQGATKQSDDTLAPLGSQIPRMPFSARFPDAEESRVSQNTGMWLVWAA